MSTNFRIEKKLNDHHWSWLNRGKNLTKDEVSAGWLLSVSPGFPVKAFPFITNSQAEVVRIQRAKPSTWAVQWIGEKSP